MGIAGAIVAVVAALAALVISPALFAPVGRQARPQGRGDEAERRRWHRLAHAVMRRAGADRPADGARDARAVAARADHDWSADRLDRDPEGQERPHGRRRGQPGRGRQGADGDRRSPRRPASAPRWRRSPTAWRAVDGVERVAPAQRSGREHVAADAIAAGDPSGPAAQRRGRRRSARSRRRSTSRVGGGAAEFVDQQAAIGSRLLLAIALLVGLTLIVLWLMTGSVVLPVKAVRDERADRRRGAHAARADLPGRPPDRPARLHAQRRRRAERLPGHGRDRVRALDRLRRVPARPDQGGARQRAAEREAVATGLARTGRVVTAAAILLAVAIGAFSTSSISFIQQIGVATATGVLVDAFVVRTLLVPSLMALLAAGTGGRRGRCAACTPDRDPGGTAAGRSDERRRARPPRQQPDTPRVAAGGGPAADPGRRGAADRQGPGRDRRSGPSPPWSAACRWCCAAGSGSARSRR